VLGLVAMESLETNGKSGFGQEEKSFEGVCKPELERERKKKKKKEKYT
jgi:hypothetical protein